MTSDEPSKTSSADVADIPRESRSIVVPGWMSANIAGERRKRNCAGSRSACYRRLRAAYLAGVRRSRLSVFELFSGGCPARCRVRLSRARSLVVDRRDEPRRMTVAAVSRQRFAGVVLGSFRSCPMSKVQLALPMNKEPQIVRSFVNTRSAAIMLRRRLASSS